MTVATLLPLLGRLADDLLALPGARPVCARHLRALADALEAAPDEPAPSKPIHAASSDVAPGPPPLVGATDEPAAAPPGPGAGEAGHAAWGLLEPSAEPQDGLGAPEADRAAPEASCVTPEAEPADWEASEPDSLFTERLAALLERRDWIGETEPSLPAVPTASEPPRPSAALALLADRLRLKAEACRALRLPPHERPNLVPDAHRLMTRLWMLDVLPQVDADHLARLYDAAAEAAELLGDRFSEAPRTEQERIVDAASHASSLLAQWIAKAQGSDSLTADPDARDIHAWLRHLTFRHCIYQQRYLSVAALAKLDSYEACRAKLDALVTRTTRRDEESAALSAVRYHAKLLVDNIDYAFHSTHHRERLIAKVCEAGEAGLPASHAKLRETLLAAYDFLPRPEMLPPFYARVLAYLDEDAAITGDDTDALGDQTAPARSPLIEQARALVAGRTLYLVGGVPVPQAIERLREALGLREVLWPQTRVHQSPEPLRAAIAREDVAAVVQLIRYSSHSLGDLREDCKALGKPFVRVVGGYGPRSIAYGLVEQASRALRSPACEAA